MTDCVTCLPAFSSSGGGDGPSSSRIYNEKPLGDNNCVNLSYQASNVFEPDTLIVRLDGIVLEPEQYTIDPDNQNFTLIIDPSDINALNSPLEPSECLRIDYSVSSSGGGGGALNDCISFV